MNNDIKAIAFFLPQYHPIPENDEWWGKGFTEWTNVAKARPSFPGHYQPHLPADLGFYDLRLSETREAQAELAKQYGLSGFCYYHYWFNGRRILERPVNEILKLGKPDFPFCLCWANENWTRTWTGGSKDILLEQKYSHDDDLEHIRTLIPIFSDSRYIKIEGKPLFLVYRTELLPNPQKTAEIWRAEALKQGIGEIFLARVEGFQSNIDPASIGFDAAVEFAPDWRNLGKQLFKSTLLDSLAKIHLFPRGLTSNKLFDYDDMIIEMLNKPEPSYLRFPCVTPSWDNSARRNNEALIVINSTPEKYEQWLATIVNRVIAKDDRYPKLIFINAWNEWAEGNHLEPDQKWGIAYLGATKNALTDPNKIRHSLRKQAHPYTRFFDFYNQYLGWRVRKIIE